jgi:hypothetical protein
MKIEAVLSNDQLKQMYGDFYESNPKVQFNNADVPDELQALVPYAVFWGVSDDIDRESLVDAAPAEVVKNLKYVVRAHSKPLNSWLAGPLADKPPFSAAYIAFSAMRMAADYC